jgi:hypothetical protein
MNVILLRNTFSVQFLVSPHSPGTIFFDLRGFLVFWQVEHQMLVVAIFQSMIHVPAMVGCISTRKGGRSLSLNVGFVILILFNMEGCGFVSICFDVL